MFVCVAKRNVVEMKVHSYTLFVSNEEESVVLYNIPNMSTYDHFKLCNKVEKGSFRFKVSVSFIQERVTDHLARWFHSNLQHPPLLSLTCIAHVHPVQHIRWHRWLPDSPEGVHNSLPHLDHEVDNSTLFFSECALHV